jgi:hypothetical protein
VLDAAHTDLADAMDHLDQAATSLTAARIKLTHLNSSCLVCPDKSTAPTGASVMQHARARSNGNNMGSQPPSR